MRTGQERKFAVRSFMVCRWLPFLRGAGGRFGVGWWWGGGGMGGLKSILEM